MNKVIYTVLIGGYEPLRPAPRFKDWDTVAFTDDMDQKPNGWTLKHLPINPELGKVRTSRLPRILPHEYLPEYDRSLYIDASVTLLQTPDVWDTGEPWLYSDHQDRGTVYDEFQAVQMTERAHPDTLHDQAERYRKAGLLGGITPQNCVIMRSHNDPEVIRVSESWWRHFSEGAPRDQLSLPMAFHQEDFNPVRITGEKMDANHNALWNIKHTGSHATNYSHYNLYFMIANYRGSAISRGIQIGKALFDRGVRNKVVREFEMPQAKNSVIVIVKEFPRLRFLQQMKRSNNKIIFDICDNEDVTLNGLGQYAPYVDGVIFPCNALRDDWQERGLAMPFHTAVIHHHGDTRFQPNDAKEFSPVCISTHTQIPDEVKELNVDCITQENGWQNLFVDSPKYNLHIGVFKDGGQDYRFKPTSKLVTAAACDANIILQRLPANLELLPAEYPYYVDDASEIPAMFERCKSEYGTDDYKRALGMIQDVRAVTTANHIASQYEPLIKAVQSPSSIRKAPPKQAEKSENPIHIFYHVGMIGRWQEIARQQIKDIYRLVTHDKFALHVSAVGSPREFEELRKIYCRAELVDRNVGRFEFPTLWRMWSHAKINGGLCLYLHTKGASRLGTRAPRGDKWREYMTCGCIGKRFECIDALRHGHDIAGCDWIPDSIPYKRGPIPGNGNHGFFAGNFFWATCDYLRQLPEPVFSPNRWNAEAWIGSGKQKPNVFEVSNIGIGKDSAVLDSWRK